MPGLTPYRKIPYPLAGEVISDATIKSMANTMTSALLTTQQTAVFSQSKSSISGVVGANVAKATDTYPSLAVNWDTGKSGPGGAAFWSSANPTRLTAPVAGLYVYGADASCSFTAGCSVAQWVKALVRKGGATVVGQDMQACRGGTYPIAAIKGAVFLTAGQYVEFGVRWSGTEAGPLSCTVNVYMALMAVQ